MLQAHDFGKAWALAGCYHVPDSSVEERERNCDRNYMTRLCSVTHAAPGLVSNQREFIFKLTF